LDRLGIDDENKLLEEIRKRRTEAVTKVAEVKKRYVNGKDPESLLRWAQGLSHLSGNRLVRNPREAERDPDLTEVTHVVEVTEPFERGLVVYYDARNGQLYSYPYTAQ
jgi:hypothetical protein